MKNRFLFALILHLSMLTFELSSSTKIPRRITIVKNDSLACCLAEIIFRSMYSSKGHTDLDSFKPFKVKLIHDSIYEIKGTLPQGAVGGVPYIRINKRDARVIDIWHTK